MKTRRHHNNTGRRQTRRGTHCRVLVALCRELGVRWGFWGWKERLGI